MGEYMCVLNKYFKNYSINKRKKNILQWLNDWK